MREPPRSSQFANYGIECVAALQEPTPPPSTVQRGKDGHLTLNVKSGDFFSSAASPGVGNMRKQSVDFTVPAPSRGGSARPSAGAPPAPPPVASSSEAQKKFGNAKAISSKDFQDASRER